MFRSLFKKQKLLFCFTALSVILLISLLFFIPFFIDEGNTISGIRFFVSLHESLYSGAWIEVPILVALFKYPGYTYIWYSVIVYTAIMATIALFCMIPNKKSNLLTLASALLIGAGTYFYPAFVHHLNAFNTTLSIVFGISVIELIIGILLWVIRIRNMLKDRKENPDFKLSYALVSNFMLFTCCLMCAWPIWNLVYVSILLLVM